MRGEERKISMHSLPQTFLLENFDGLHIFYVSIWVVVRQILRSLDVSSHSIVCGLSLSSKGEFY